MLGTGTNRANISGIKLDLSDMEIEGLGEGLLSKEQINADLQNAEERKEPNYIEALQFTDTKPKKQRVTKATTTNSDEKRGESGLQAEEINFEDTMRSQQPHASNRRLDEQHSS